MGRFHRGLAVLLLAAGGFGCSIMDPDDRQELRDRMGVMPPEDILLMKRVVMNAKAINWLRGRPDNDQMGKLQCRVKAGITWGDWTDQEPTFTVFEMLDCLRGVPFATTYLMCKDQWESVQIQARKTDAMNTPPAAGEVQVECRFQWDFRYDPADLPADLTDESRITIDSMIDVLVQLPAPPPGWAFPQLVPLLCPLGAGAGWGCPDSPDDPGGGGAPSPGGG